LKFGVYLSPWDRNHPEYSRPAYLEYYRAQLRELLTNYGEISEVWFDGANGGDGYYGGAREMRTIDRRTYYDWATTWALVRELQPNAVMFSDVGPDVRWVGNEQGYAGETNWSAYTPSGPEGDAPAPGYTKYLEGIEGHPDGASWIPAECDVSIRPGWFYHPSEDSLVKSPHQMMGLYLRSVGRNAALLLNVPLDRRGLVAPADSVALMGFRALRDRSFAEPVVAQLQRLHGSDSIWTATLDHPTKFNTVELSEDVTQGQRVSGFRVEVWKDGSWVSIFKVTTIGRKRIILVEPASSERIRLVVTSFLAPAAIRPLRLYHMPLEVHRVIYTGP
jgi:alpha-L-fucosidase